MEQWKKIQGYNYYEISNYGRVKSLARGLKEKGKFLKLKPAKGYFRVTLFDQNKRKIYFVHRLVATAFIPNPDDKPFINHIDCNPANNNAENLEWCTPKENSIHAKKHKITACGERNGNSKLTEKDVYNIYDALKYKIPPKLIAKKYEVHYDMILRIKDGRGWQNLGLEPIKNQKSINISLENILLVEQLLDEGISTRDIKNKSNISRSTIFLIKKGNYNEFKERIREFI